MYTTILIHFRSIFSSNTFIFIHISLGIYGSLKCSFLWSGAFEFFQIFLLFAGWFWIKEVFMVHFLEVNNEDISYRKRCLYEDRNSRWYMFFKLSVLKAKIHYAINHIWFVIYDWSYRVFQKFMRIFTCMICNICFLKSRMVFYFLWLIIDF